jgi:hypothetical protein
MDVSKKEAAAIRRTLDYWQKSSLIAADQAAVLRADLKVIPFDWRLLARLSFIVAIISIVTALAAIAADEVLLKLLAAIFDAPHYVKLIMLSLLSAAILSFGYEQRLQHPQRIFSTEAIMFLGVLSIAGAVYQFGMTFDNGSGRYSLLLLISFVVYGVLALKLQSNLIWIFALVSIGGWFGAETGYMSGWGAYYLGMSYPLRFVVFGGALTAAAFGIQNIKIFEICRRSTLVMGLLYLFIALWILSIWGNTGHWMRGHGELFLWSLLFGAAACAAIVHGLKTGDGVTRGFGIVFLFINLYTRYFEYFWDGMHKAIFFAVIAVSFWMIGRHAEKIWSLGESVQQAEKKD